MPVTAVASEDENDKDTRKPLSESSEEERLDNNEKKKEDIMSREDLPKDFPTPEDSYKDVVGRAVRETYAPFVNTDDTIPGPIGIKGESGPKGEPVKDNLMIDNLGHIGPVGLSGSRIGPNDTRLSNFASQTALSSTTFQLPPSPATIDSLYDQTIAALSNEVSKVGVSEHASEAIYSLTSLLAVLDVLKDNNADKVNPRATRAGEMPLKK